MFADYEIIPGEAPRLQLSGGNACDVFDDVDRFLRHTCHFRNIPYDLTFMGRYCAWEHFNMLAVGRLGYEQRVQCFLDSIDPSMSLPLPPPYEDE